MQYSISFIPIILLFVIIFINSRNEKIVMKNILNKRKMEDGQMFELAQKFIDKDCVIYTFNSQLTGIIKEVNDGGILIEKDGNFEAVNFDYIVRIREYPRTKNGKKKSVILD